MANNQTPERFRQSWGTYATFAQLPNSAGATVQSDNLAVGDLAWVTGIGLFVCTVRTRGAADWLQVTQSVPVGDSIELYVDGANGSDSNPGTQAEPFQTLAPAADVISKVPLPVHYIVNIVDATSPYNFDPFMNTPWPTLLGSINIRGIPETAAFSGTATGGTTLTLTQAGAGWTADEHVGRFSRITNGAREDTRRLVVSNTTDTLTLCRAAASSYGAGDTFDIIDPGVELRPSASGVLCGVNGENRVSTNATSLNAFRLINVGLNGAASVTVNLLGFVELYGVQQKANCGLSGITRAGTASLVGTGGLANVLGLASDALWMGYGLNAMARSTFNPYAGFLGFVACQWFLSPGIAGTTRYFLGGRVAPAANNRAGVQMQVNDGPILLAGSSTSNRLTIAPLSGSTFSGLVGVLAPLGSAVNVGGGCAIDVSTGATSDAIQSTGGSISIAALTSGFPTAAGSRYGARARFSGKIQVNDAGTGVTGTTADFQAGEDAATVAGGFAAVGNALSGLSSDGSPVSDGSVIIRVV